ncbi:cysteine dioxygenase [Marinactinospora thermotolerans]|uniref:Cysteine dioxygenase type I n=1 Tax=Marinactinospora thermotolerans DSM 45154 TaxID=1122192 RepID=A0A1T4TF41_9ACTN|nr:cysteine dioxygenase family protein [Marinactinospora thermotolerans]SKA39093.1 Cysteine dioxygenase type I [Marinactinospora thermotolerans DSM 45154]
MSSIVHPSSRAGGPTPMSLDRLLALTRATAEEVRAGLHDLRFDAEERWSTRLRGDDYTDIWLITWTRDQSTSLHDHAGSLGALTVVSGSLTEQAWRSGPRGGGLRGRRLTAGHSAGFPVGHVHDVLNVADTPAVSVHAYSPPLTAMSYYVVDDAGALRRTHSVLTHEPEPGAPVLDEVPRRAR